jgi:hypothetical protein
VTDERIPEVIMDWVRMQKISKCKPKINWREAVDAAMGTRHLLLGKCAVWICNARAANRASIAVSRIYNYLPESCLTMFQKGVNVCPTAKLWTCLSRN